MKVSDLVRELNLTVFCGEAGLDAEISGGYTSDLLSDVMGHIDEGMLWVTMQTHQNITYRSEYDRGYYYPERCGCRPDRERGFAGRGDA